VKYQFAQNDPFHLRRAEALGSTDESVERMLDWYEAQGCHRASALHWLKIGVEFYTYWICRLNPTE
jgi:hypothetical protein